MGLDRTREPADYFNGSSFTATGLDGNVITYKPPGKCVRVQYMHAGGNSPEGSGGQGLFDRQVSKRKGRGV